jgi:DNA-binding NtrC family response regulator
MHALAVIDDDEVYEGVRRVMEHSNWHLHRATNLEEAMRLLEDADLRGRVSVALCAPRVCGCGWRDLKAGLTHCGCPASVVVVDRQAGADLWNEVLGGGGYEVVDYPPDPHELFRVVTQAWRRWHGLAGHAAVAPG